MLLFFIILFLNKMGCQVNTNKSFISYATKEENKELHSVKNKKEMKTDLKCIKSGFLKGYVYKTDKNKKDALVSKKVSIHNNENNELTFLN